MKSLKCLSAFVLIVGGVTACYLTLGVAFSFLFYIFMPPPLSHKVLGYGSLIGPVPLVLGAILLLFGRMQKLGAVLVLAGCALLSIYMVICFVRLDVAGGVWHFLWFILAPVAVLAVDIAALRIVYLTKAVTRPQQAR